jgi:hypothetical protein
LISRLVVQGTMDGGLAAELNVDSWRRCRSRWRSCGMMTAQVKHLATLVAGMPEMQTVVGVGTMVWGPEGVVARLGAPAVMIRGGS